MRALASIVRCGVLYGWMCVFAADLAVAESGDDRGVSVMTACDSSPEELDAAVRELHGRIARRVANETLHRSGLAARRAGGATHQLDVSVTRWRVARAAGHTDVTAEIRLVLCDDKGRMLSIVNGKATASGQGAELAVLREQAIAEGVGQLVARLARSRA